jgi:hypothetical protein
MSPLDFCIVCFSLPDAIAERLTVFSAMHESILVSELYIVLEGLVFWVAFEACADHVLGIGLVVFPLFLEDFLFDLIGSFSPSLLITIKVPKTPET